MTVMIGLKRRKTKLPGIHIDKELYDRSAILENMRKLEILKTEKRIITNFENKTICNAGCSEKYGIFDFGTFVTKTLPKIETFFKPDTFSLKINRGIQELKLYDKEFYINDKEHRKMMVFFNSSNGYHPLIIDAGLFRKVCSNGQMAPASINSFQIKTKHFYRTISESTKLFEEKMEFLPEVFTRQITFIENLSGRNMSFYYFLQKLIMKSNSEESKTMLKVSEQLGNKLLFSQTDSMDTTCLNEQQLSSLKNPEKLFRGSSLCEDLEIPLQILFNCYTEIFRDRHVAVLEKENRRITDIILN